MTWGKHLHAYICTSSFLMKLVIHHRVMFVANTTYKAQSLDVNNTGEEFRTNQTNTTHKLDFDLRAFAKRDHSTTSFWNFSQTGPCAGVEGDT